MVHLHAVGNFQFAGGQSAQNVARWDGSSWHALEQGLSYHATSLAVFDDVGAEAIPAALYIGGVFEFAGQQSSHRVARYGCPPVRQPNPDLNGDSDVDGFDLATLLGQWTGAATYAPCPPAVQADLNGDCKINGFDLANLLAN